MDVRGFIESNAGELVGALKEWLSIPSVSGDPARHQDVRASAQWLAAHLRRLDAAGVEYRPLDGPLPWQGSD